MTVLRKWSRTIRTQERGDAMYRAATVAAALLVLATAAVL